MKRARGAPAAAGMVEPLPDACMAPMLPTRGTMIMGTTACACSLRARAEPTVSTPVTWNEIADARPRRKPEVLRFEATQVVERVEEFGDLFLPDAHPAAAPAQARCGEESVKPCATPHADPPEGAHPSAHLPSRSEV